MSRKKRPTAATDLGHLLPDLYRLREGEGLTRLKVSRAGALCDLPIMHREVARFDQKYGRKHLARQVAYRLLPRLIGKMENESAQLYLFNAFALGGRPRLADLSERRQRLAEELDVNIDTVKGRENAAVDELALWLMDMHPGEPETLLGDYLQPTGKPPADGDFAEYEEFGQVVWDSLQVSAEVDRAGYVASTECVGLVRAVADEVTEYCICTAVETQYVAKFQRIELIKGGTLQEDFEDVRLPYFVDYGIRFVKPLHPAAAKPQQIWWRMVRSPSEPWSSTELGIAYLAAESGHALTLEARFSAKRLPVRGYCYTAQSRITHYRRESRDTSWLLKDEHTELVLKDNLLSYTWPEMEEGSAYVLRWDWLEDMSNYNYASLYPIVVAF